MSINATVDYGQYTHLGKGFSPSDDQRNHTHNTDYRFDPFANQNYTNYQFPEAAKGLELRLKEVILGLISDGRYDIWFSLILPLVKLPGLDVFWNVWTLDTPDPEAVPYEGPVTYTSSRKTEMHDSIERRGKGFKMEIDFLSDPEGQRYLQMQLQIIAQGVKRWMAYDTVYALINCNKYRELIQMKFGHLQISATQLLDHEVDTFAALIKQWKQIDMVIEAAKAALRRNEVVADTIIIPQEMSVFLKMVHDERIFAKYAGPDGMTGFKQSPDLLGEFRGLTVVQAQFNTIHGANKLAPNALERRVRVGENYEMFARNRDNMLTHYTSKERDLYVYTHEIDDQKKIYFKDGLMNCHVFDLTDESPYTRYVMDEIARLNAMGKKAPPAQSTFMTNDSNSYNVIKAHYGRSGLPISVASIADDNETWIPADYIGHLMYYALNKKDLQRMAESLLLPIFNPANLSKINSAFNELITVIDGIQNQEYNEFYWQEIIRLNINRQLNGTGDFIGEKTPVFSSPFMGDHPIVVEWKPNVFGLLDLPQIDLNDPRNKGVYYPAGLGSGIGLVALEAEADKPTSPWRDLGRRIKPAMQVLREVAETFNQNFPGIIPVRDDSRSPWFHKADTLAIFLDCTLPLNGDPIFLSTARHQDEVGQNENNNAIDQGRIYYTPIKLYTRGQTDASIAADRVAANDLGLRDIAADGRRPTDAELVEYNNPITGKTYFVHTPSIIDGNAIPPYLMVFSVIGGGTVAGAYEVIIESVNALALDSAQKEELLNRLATKVMRKPTSGYNPSRAIRVLRSELINGVAVTAAIDEFVGITQRSALKAYLERVPDAEDEDNEPPRFSLENLPSAKVAKYGSLENELQAIYARLRPIGPAVLPPFAVASRRQIKELRSIRLEDLVGNDTDAVRKLYSNFQRLLTELYEKMPVNTEVEQRRGLNFDRKVAADYHRSPFVMSRALLTSIQFLPAPLIKPGNPGTNFQVPLELHDTEDGVLPNDDWRRSPYLTISQKISEGLYNIANLRQFEGEANINANYDTFKPKKRSTSDFVGGFDHYLSDHENDSYSPMDTGSRKSFGSKKIKSGYSIGALGRDGETSFDYDTLEDFRGRKNNAAYYNLNENARVPGTDPNGQRKVATNVMKFRFKQIENEPTLMRMIMHALLMVPIKWSFLSNMIDKNIYVPFGVVNWRDFEHGMLSAIVLKRGIDTGANYYNKANFMMQPNADVKTVSASFTFHAKTIVQNRENVYVLEDIMPWRYYSGGNTTYFTSPREYAEMGDRRAESPSIFCTLHPVTETSLPKHCSLQGFLPVSEINPALDSQVSHYWNADFYNNLLGLSNMSRSGAANSSFSEWDERRNVVFQPGHAFFYNYEKNLFATYRASKGHRGDGNSRGSNKVWNGETEKFPDFNPNDYALE